MQMTIPKFYELIHRLAQLLRGNESRQNQERVKKIREKLINYLTYDVNNLLIFCLQFFPQIINNNSTSPTSILEMLRPASAQHLASCAIHNKLFGTLKEQTKSWLDEELQSRQGYIPNINDLEILKTIRALNPASPQGQAGTEIPGLNAYIDFIKSQYYTDNNLTTLAVICNSIKYCEIHNNLEFLRAPLLEAMSAYETHPYPYWSNNEHGQRLNYSCMPGLFERILLSISLLLPVEARLGLTAGQKYINTIMALFITTDATGSCISNEFYTMYQQALKTVKLPTAIQHFLAQSPEMEEYIQQKMAERITTTCFSSQHSAMSILQEDEAAVKRVFAAEFRDGQLEPMALQSYLETAARKQEYRLNTFNAADTTDEQTIVANSAIQERLYVDSELNGQTVNSYTCSRTQTLYFLTKSLYTEARSSIKVQDDLVKSQEEKKQVRTLILIEIKKLFRDNYGIELEEDLLAIINIAFNRCNSTGRMDAVFNTLEEMTNYPRTQLPPTQTELQAKIAVTCKYAQEAFEAGEYCYNLITTEGLLLVVAQALRYYTQNSTLLVQDSVLAKAIVYCDFPLYELFLLCASKHYFLTMQAILKFQNNINVNVVADDGGIPLIIAVENENIELVNLLLDCNAQVNMQDEYGQTSLMWACQSGNILILRQLLAREIDINMQNHDSQTALMWSCKSGSSTIVRLLLAHGADSSMQDHDGHTALMWASQSGHLTIVHQLLTHGVDQDHEGKTVMIWACQYGNIALVQLLLTHGFAVDMQGAHGQTALMLACYYGQTKVVELLFTKNAASNIQDNIGQTALMRSCQNGNIEIIKLLFANEADSNIQSKDGITALMEACYYCHLSAVQLLLVEGAEINLQSKDGITALMMSCEKNDIATVRLLLAHGLDINIEDNASRTALTVASRCHNREILQLIVAHGAYLQLPLARGFTTNIYRTDGITALIEACCTCDLEMVQLLLSQGIDINLFSKDGITALMKACEQSDITMVKLLLVYAANIHMQDNSGRTAMMIALECGNSEIVDLLFSHDIQDNLVCHTALMWACQDGDIAIVELQLAYGANINMQDKDGQTALITACKYGHLEIVQCILDNGADINMQDKDGNTARMIALNGDNMEIVQLLFLYSENVPLLFIDSDNAQLPATHETESNMNNINTSTALIEACKYGYVEIVQLLLTHGADSMIKDQNGRTALIWACGKNNLHIVQLLLDHKANNGETALIAACRTGHLETVQLLLNYEADINIQDNNGETALIVAGRTGHLETLQLLLNYEAASNNRKKPPIINPTGMKNYILMNEHSDILPYTKRRRLTFRTKNRKNQKVELKK